MATVKARQSTVINLRQSDTQNFFFVFCFSFSNYNFVVGSIDWGKVCSRSAAAPAALIVAGQISLNLPRNLDGTS